MKIWRYEKRKKFETEQNFWFRILYNSITGNQIVLKFYFSILWTVWEINRQKALLPCRTGPGPFMTDIDRVVKQKYFYSISYIEKSIVFEILPCLKVPYDSISLSFTPCRSQEIKIVWPSVLSNQRGLVVEKK